MSLGSAADAFARYVTASRVRPADWQAERRSSATAVFSGFFASFSANKAQDRARISRGFSSSAWAVAGCFSARCC